MKLTNYVRDAFVRAVMEDVPSTDYVEMIRNKVVAIAASKLPKDVKKVWDNAELRGYVRLEHRYVGGLYTYYPSLDNLQLTPEEQKDIDQLEAQRDAQDAKLGTLREKVKAVAYSVTTVKALVEQLPEFEKYLPKDAQAASRMVSAVANLVADLVQAGWPDGGKKKVEEPAAA